jgi:Acetyltransferase (GNAT) family
MDIVKRSKNEVTLRTPRMDDWQAILDLAYRSLAELPNAPSQQDWLDNRRSFSPSEGIQYQFVACHGDRIVGYACIEHRDKLKLHPPASAAAEGEYRVFVVVAPSDRLTLGIRLLKELRERLLDLGADRAWTTEYEADVHFISFLEGVGFLRQAVFKLPDGSRAIRLVAYAPFVTLAVVEELHEEQAQ